MKTVPLFLTFLSAAFIETQAEPDTLKVFVLAGQSNMVGHGKVEYGRDPNYDPSQPGAQREIVGGVGGLRHLATTPSTASRFQHTLANDGAWAVRDDVWVFSTAPGKESGPHTVGFGKGSWFGPEYAFGHIVGDALEEPVLLIKTAWGGHSLGVNFRPPSSGSPNYEDTRFAPEAVGGSYREMVSIVEDVLENLGDRFPELQGHQPEIVGFGWHQGWNDAGSAEMVAEYASNMRNLIHDLRKEWGVENLPVVIANTGMIGLGTEGRRNDLCEIQLALGDPAQHPEFGGTVRSIDTRGFKRTDEESPSHFGYHWNHNAESHYLVGESMGQAMLALLGVSR